MRLTLVISSLSSGGAERVMSTLANAWSGKGWDVTILTTHDGGRAPDYALEPGVKVESVDPRRGGLGRQIEIVKRIRRQVKFNSPDVVVSFLNYTNILALIATRGLGVPVIVSERLDPSIVDIGPLWSRLRRWTYRWTDALVAQTPTAAQRFEPMAPGRVRVAPNPVFGLSTDPGADDPVTFDRPTFLAVGRLHPQKGFDVLIRAMAQVHGLESAWQLIILGEGDSRAELEQIIEASELGDTIRLQGRVLNPWPWLKAADVFVLSSHSEGFPNALCEAMAAGLPVVSTDCPSGPADLITDGEDGLLVPVDDADALAEHMLQLARSQELRTRLGAGAEQIRNRYRLAAILDLWDEIIAEVIGTTPPTSSTSSDHIE